MEPKLVTSFRKSYSTDPWAWRTLGLLIGLGLVRVIYLAYVPVDLVHDEAYYWDWSRHPAWGYYSKPPMVAWLIGLSTWLGGPSPFFVRLPAALLTTSGVIFVSLLARRMYGPAAGFWAALLSACTPGNTVLSLVMTIDAPLLFAWGGALWAFWWMLEAPRTVMPYVMCAAALALGFLSKQTMLGFLPLAGLFLLLSQTDRLRLIDWRVWATALVALLCLTPVLVWNSQHDWVTLVHTSEHFKSESVTLTRRLVRSLEFFGAQMGVVSPITWIAVVGLWWGLFSLGRRIERRELYLLCFSGIPLVAVAVLSLRQRVEANWPAPFYVAGLILLAGRWGNPLTVRERFWRRHAVQCGVAFSLGTWVLPFAIQGSSLQGTRWDAAVRMWGWQELAQQVNARLNDLPHGKDTLIVSSQKRGIAGELAFYLPHHPQVFVFNNSGIVTSQYDVWGGPAPQDQGRDALLLAEEAELPPDLKDSFAEVVRLPDIEVPIGTSGRKHHLYAWRAHSLQHWPVTPAIQATRPSRWH